MTDSDQPVISLRGVDKLYQSPSGPFAALREISLEVKAGEFVAIVGRSGSGKSTLMNILSGIDDATAGEVIICGTPLHTLGQRALSRWRGVSVGVVFQFFQLLPTLSVAENVMLPMDFCNSVPLKERRAKAMSLLDRMGIADQAGKLPSSLSGGEQQRAAIARALANDPPLLAADEPTGNLDSRTSDALLELFTTLKGEGKTIVMVTHERDVTRFATREIRLADGRVIGDLPTALAGARGAAAHA
jgi:putative ABC transport system ATP-binding protein